MVNLVIDDRRDRGDISNGGAQQDVSQSIKTVFRACTHLYVSCFGGNRGMHYDAEYRSAVDAARQVSVSLLTVSHVSQRVFQSCILS